MGANTKEEVIITRLRTGHSNLYSTLNIIGKHPTGICKHYQLPETMEHVIISCNKYISERKIMEDIKRLRLTGAR